MLTGRGRDAAEMDCGGLLGGAEVLELKLHLGGAVPGVEGGAKDNVGPAAAPVKAPQA